MINYDMIANFLIVLALFLQSEASPTSSVCRRLFENQEEMAQALEIGNFRMNRDLGDYLHLLNFKIKDGKTFSYFLNLLKPWEQWVDMGSGVALPMIEFAQARFGWRGNLLRPNLYDDNHRLPKMVAVNYSDTFTIGRHVTLEQAKMLQSYLDQVHPRFFRFIVGNFEHVDDPRERLDPTHLITDVMGPMSYSSEISDVIAKELSLLAPGGALFASSSFAQTKFVRPNGYVVSARVYLEQIRGVSIAYAPDKEVTELRMIRNDEPIYVPPARLVEMQAGSPPLRTFVLEE